MDSFAEEMTKQVVIMPRFEKQQISKNDNELEPFRREPIARDDLGIEDILDNLNSTPLGQVLQRIASMPDVRCEKVLEVRQNISKGQYELNERLDRILERILEDLKT
jgi:anti-sigma28 factor (negative regulator of flagellin synthesis)